VALLTGFCRFATAFERLKVKAGDKAHPTQKARKPAATGFLIATTNPGDVGVDPFFGNRPTTGAVAKDAVAADVPSGSDTGGLTAALPQQRLPRCGKFDASALWRLPDRSGPDPACRSAGGGTRGCCVRERTHIPSANRCQGQVRAMGTLIRQRDVKGSYISVGAAYEGAPSCQVGWDLLHFQEREGKFCCLSNSMRQQIRAEMAETTRPN